MVLWSVSAPTGSTITRTTKAVILIKNQPSIGHWNLWTWLNNLIPLAEPEQKDEFKEELARCLEQFEPIFLEHYGQGLCQKWDFPISTKTALIVVLHF